MQNKETNPVASKEISKMDLDELRNDIARKQKMGLPFMCASIVIWALIMVVTMLGLPQDKENTLVFCCSCPLMPLAWIIGKALKVNIFDKSNPLNNAGLILTCTQLLYLLIVMWVFNAVPDKMVMVYAMVFGSHLFPFSWLYKSVSYQVYSILMPIAFLCVGCMFSATVVAATALTIESLLVVSLFIEVNKLIHTKGENYGK